MPGKLDTPRTWRRIQVCKSEARKRLILEKNGRAECIVCRHHSMLETIDHPKGRLILCDVCHDVYLRISDVGDAKSRDDVVKAIVKAHGRLSR